MRCSLVLIISLFIIFPLTPPLWAQESDILYIEAVNALNVANYEKAIALFQKHLKLYPEDEKTIMVRYNLAEVLYRQQKFSEAADLYEKVGNLEPDDKLAPEALSKAGECYGKLNDLVNLERVFKKIIRLYPETLHAEFARYNLAGLKAQVNIDSSASLPTAVPQTPAAPPEPEAPMKIEIQEDVLLKTAKDVFKAKEYKTALDLFYSFLHNFPKSQEASYAQLKIAECHYYLQYHKKALAAYKKVLDYPQNPYKAYAQYSVGWCYYQIGDYQNALLNLQKLIKDYPDTKYVNSAKKEVEEITFKFHEEYSKKLFDRAKELHEKNELKSASAALQELLDKYPESSVAKEAGELLAKIKELLSDLVYKEAKALYEEGEENLNKGQMDDAEDKFKQLVLKYSESNYSQLAQNALKVIQQKRIEQKAKVEFEKGLKYLEHKDYPRARSKFEEVITKFPQSPYQKEAELKLKDILSQESDVGAYELYKKALGLIRDEDNHQAIEAFQQLIDQYPDSNYVALAKAGIKSTQDSTRSQRMQRQFEIAQKYYELGDYAGAIEAFKEVQTNYPQTPYAQRANKIIQELSVSGTLTERVADEYELAQRYYREGELNRAKEKLVAIIEKYPKSYYAKAAQESIESINKRITNEGAKDLYDTGRRFQEYAEYSKAMVKYEEVLNRYPNNYWAVYALYARGETLYAQGGYQEAKGEWQKVIDEFKNSDLAPHALYHVAECCEQLKEFEQAKENYQKLQREYPTSIYAQGELADLIIERIGGLKGK